MQQVRCNLYSQTMNKSLEAFMTTADVAALLKIKAITLRSRIHRLMMGKSCPDFPPPLGKVAGGWIWDRLEVMKFAEAKGLLV